MSPESQIPGGKGEAATRGPWQARHPLCWPWRGSWHCSQTIPWHCTPRVALSTAQEWLREAAIPPALPYLQYLLLQKWKSISYLKAYQQLKGWDSSTWTTILTTGRLPAPRDAGPACSSLSYPGNPFSHGVKVGSKGEPPRNIPVTDTATSGNTC